MRVILTAISFMTRQRTKALPTHKFEEALDFLGLVGNERTPVREVVARFRLRLGLSAHFQALERKAKRPG